MKIGKNIFHISFCGLYIGQKLWQRHYYDRSIRDPKECNRIAAYIENNPAFWDTDEY